MKTNILLVWLICAALLFGTSCSSDEAVVEDADTEQPGDTGDEQSGDEDDENEDDNDENGEEEDGEEDGEDDETSIVDEDDDDSELNPQDVNYENAVLITFSDEGVSVNNQFDGNGVTIDNNNGHVVITSTLTDTELNYILSGKIDDGSVKIYGNYKFGLVLNGVSITNPRGAAINIQCGKKVTVTLEDGTNNWLFDGADYDFVDGEDMKGTFFSEGQLNFYGNGILYVRGYNKHAICTDDYFRMYEGNIVVKEAASDAIHAKDYTRIDGGSIITSSVGEGIDCDGYIYITGGTLNHTTSGQKGHGLKSGEYVKIEGNPQITITVNGIASKGINAKGDITITNGTLNIKTTGDAYFDTDDQDTSSAAAIKGDGTFVMDNGTVTIHSSGSGGKGINIEELQRDTDSFRRTGDRDRNECARSGLRLRQQPFQHHRRCTDRNGRKHQYTHRQRVYATLGNFQHLYLERRSRTYSFQLRNRSADVQIAENIFVAHDDALQQRRAHS